MHGFASFLSHLLDEDFLGLFHVLELALAQVHRWDIMIAEVDLAIDIRAVEGVPCYHTFDPQQVKVLDE